MTDPIDLMDADELRANLSRARWLFGELAEPFESGLTVSEFIVEVNAFLDHLQPIQTQEEQ